MTETLTTTSSPVEARAALVKALRSGQYKQGFAYLKKAGRHCCLGVACELYKQACLDLAEIEDRSGHSTFDGSLSLLPAKVAHYFGIDNSGQLIKPIYENILNVRRTLTSLVDCNDSGLSFNRIADIIETGQVITYDNS